MLEMRDRAKVSPLLTRETEMVRERWFNLQSVISSLELGVFNTLNSLKRSPRTYTEETMPLGVPVEVIRAPSAPTRVGSRTRRMRSFIARLFS